jgi:O-antigen/teichoic acid export membrane protein
MQRQMKFKELAFCETIAAVARLTGALIGAASGVGVWSFVIAELAMASVDSTLKRRLSSYRFTYQLVPDASAIREVRSYISGIIGCNLAVYLNTNCDNLIIGKLLGSQALGYYNFAYQLAMIPVFALSQINRVNFSVLTQQDSQGKKIYIHRMLHAYGLTSAPIYGLAFLVAPWLFPMLFGQRWIGAVHLFQIVLLFAYTRGFMSIMGAILDSLNKPAINAAINWAIIPLSVISYLIGATFGTTGVAIAVAVVMGFIATSWLVIMVCRIAKYDVEFLARPILMPAAIISLSMVITTHTPVPAYLQMYLQPLILIISYTFILSIYLPKGVSQVTSSIREILLVKSRV